MIFEGIEEETRKTWQQCETKLAKLLNEKMALNDIKFERVHRLGGKFTGETRTRPVIAKFHTYKQRDLVWLNRSKLKDTNVWIHEDFPKEIKENRDKLFPIFLAAKKSEQITSVSLKLDQLFLNGKLYTAENIDKVPDFLKPHNRSTVTTDNTVVFSSKHSILSNLHPLKIMIDGRNYNTNEQFIQYSKAVLFKDFENANKVLAENDPYKQMEIGRNIQGYKRHIWQANAPSILNRVNRAKYNQHTHAKEVLISTGTRLIGEATKDRLFGIGQTLTDETVSISSTWTGQNLMGTTLMDIRNDLKH